LRVEEHRVELIQDLQEAVEARDEFLGLASHELRTPLAALQLQHGSLLRELRSRNIEGLDKLVERVEMGTSQIFRLVRLVESMIEASPGRASELALERSEIDLVE